MFELGITDTIRRWKGDTRVLEMLKKCYQRRLYDTVRDLWFRKGYLRFVKIRRAVFRVVAREKRG